MAFSKSWNAPSYTQAAIDAIGGYETLSKETPGGSLVIFFFQLGGTAACLFIRILAAEHYSK